MYNWRQMTPAQRQQALAHRKTQGQPWHGMARRTALNAVGTTSAQRASTTFR